MPGLINQQVAKPPAAPGQVAQPAPGAQKPQDPATQRIAIAAKKVLAQPQMAQHIVQLCKAAGDPVKGIAQGAIFLLKVVLSYAQGQLQASAIPPAISEAVVDVVKVVKGARLYPVDANVIKQATTLALQMYVQSVKAKSAQQQPQPAMPAPAAPPAAPPMPVPAAAPAAVPMGA